MVRKSLLGFCEILRTNKDRGFFDPTTRKAISIRCIVHLVPPQTHKYRAEIKVGIAHDINRLVAESRLIFGGVAIDFHSGLMGNSDADVLIHVTADTFLEALRLANSGQVFSDAEIWTQDLDSKKIREKGRWQGRSNGLQNFQRGYCCYCQRTEAFAILSQNSRIHFFDITNQSWRYWAHGGNPRETRINWIWGSHCLLCRTILTADKQLKSQMINTGNLNFLSYWLYYHLFL
jgi:hypothetical protein